MMGPPQGSNNKGGDERPHLIEVRKEDSSPDFTSSHAVCMKCFMIWLATLSALVVLQGVAAVPALTFTGHVGADFLPDSPHPFPVLQLFDDAAPNVSSCLNYSFLSNATAGVPLDECALQQGSGRDLVSAYLAWSWTEDRLYLGIHCGGVCGDANGNGQVGEGEAIALLIDLSPSWNGDFTPTLALGLPTVNRSSDSNFTSAVLAEIEAWNPDEAYLQFGTVLANVTLVCPPLPLPRPYSLRCPPPVQAPPILSSPWMVLVSSLVLGPGVPGQTNCGSESRCFPGAKVIEGRGQTWCPPPPLGCGGWRWTATMRPFSTPVRKRCSAWTLPLSSRGWSSRCSSVSTPPSP